MYMLQKKLNSNFNFHIDSFVNQHFVFCHQLLKCESFLPILNVCRLLINVTPP